MKTINCIRPAALALTALALWASPGAWADTVTHTLADTNALSIQETNEPEGIVIQKGDKKITISAELASPPERLPREVLEKLSPEQIVELEKAWRTRLHIEEVLVPIAFFGAVITIVAMILGQRVRQTKLLHETIRAMIEKGQPIPPELLQPPVRRRPKSDLRRGLVFAGIGIGLTVWLALDGGTKWALGLIPLLMGAAFLITWKVEQSKNGDRA
jgi:hypothetical protein